MKKQTLILFLTTMLMVNQSAYSQEEQDRNYVVLGGEQKVSIKQEDNDDDIVIPDLREERRLWLNFFKEYNQLEDFNTLIEWETSDATSIVSNYGIISPHSSETGVPVPQGNLGIKSIYNLDFSNNNLINIDFLVSLNEIRGDIDFRNNSIYNLNGLYFLENIEGNAYFDNNDIRNINNLLNLKNIGGELTLYNNNNLDKIYGLKNIESGIIRLDEPSQYIGKVSFSSVFCKTFNDGNITVYLKDTDTRLIKSDLCENNPWLSYFKENEQLENFNSLIEWESEDDFSVAKLDNKELSNFDIPEGEIEVKSLYSLDFSNNELMNISFLKGLEKVRDSLLFNDNYIRTVNDLSSLKIVEGDLNLSNNALRDLRGLENLNKVDRLFLNDNSITSFEEIKNLFDVKDIYIDSVNQYEKLEYTTPLCNSFINNVSDFVIQETGLSAEVEDICKNKPDFSGWLTYFKSKNQLTDFNNIFDWIVFDDFAYLNNLGIGNEDFANLPDTIGVYSIFGLDLSQNNLKSINFLESVREIRTNLYLQSNDITNLKGLTQLNSVGVLDVSKNKELTSIRSLSNLNSAQRVIFDTPTQYTTKPNYYSDFCQSLITGDVSAVDVRGNELNVNSLCYETPLDKRWLYFLKKYNQFQEYNEISDWRTVDEEVIINKGLSDGDIPEATTKTGYIYTIPLPVNSIFTFQLDNNKLTKLDFMSEVNEVRGDLSLRNNELVDLTGLSNVSSVGNLDLYNNYLFSLEGLNLDSVNILNISDNDLLTDISALESLSFADKVIVDNPVQYTVKPDANSNFCEAVYAGNIIISQNNLKEVSGNSICAGDKSDQAAWLYFFQKRNKLETLSSLEDWYDSGLSVNLDYENLNENTVPKRKMGVEKIYELNFSNNQFKDVDFLKGVREVKGDLKLNKNYIADLNGLQNITKVGGLIDLHDNELKINDLNYLSNLEEAKGLYIYNNYFFESLNGIKNLKGNTKEDPVILRIEPTSLYVENYKINRQDAEFPEQKVLPLLELYTPLCFGIATKRTIAYERSGLKEADMSVICEGITNSVAWLEFFKDNNYLLDYVFLEEWEGDDSIVTLNNKNFTSQDVPSGSMGIRSLYSLDFSNNNLTNVIFMGVTEEVRGDLDLSNNNINSLKGLNLLSVVDGELKLHNNDYNDLKPISNIGKAEAIRIDNPEGFEKLSYTSPLCRGVEEGSVNIYIGEQTERLILEDVCYTVDNDPNTAWLDFFHRNEQLTDFSILEEWETDLQVADVSDSSFSDINIPSLVMNINELGTLNFSNNNLVGSFFLLNINKVREVNLSNNNISNLEGLSNIEKGNINISGNNNITSIIPLSNLNQSGSMIFDTVDQYTSKPVIETDFCQGIIDLNIKPLTTERELSLKDVCLGATSDEEWLSFFQLANQTLLKLNSIKSWEFQDEEAIILSEEKVVIIDDEEVIIPDEYISVENSHMPTSNLPVSSLYSLNIIDQEITNLNFLSSVNEIRGVLNLSNNKLTDITGLSSINTKIPKLVLSGNPLVSTTGLDTLDFDVLDLSNTQLSTINDMSLTEIDNLYLNDNLLTNLNGLRNLTVVNKEMTIVNNPNLTDITGISNLSKGTLIIDLVEQYTELPDYSTPFCKAILSNDMKVVKIEEIINEQGEEEILEIKIYVEEICKNVTDDALWLSFFHRNNELLKLDIMNEWNTLNEEAYLSGHILDDRGDFKELSEIIFDNSMLPSGNIGVTSLFSLNFSHNKLTSISFLNGLEEVRENLLLNNNNLENINSLSELSKVEKTIDLSNTTITDVSPLSNLKKVGTLDISGNPDLKNLSGIENLANALTLYLDDPSQYELIDFTSDLCFAISRGEVLPKVKATGNGIYIEELCNGVPNDAKWLSYLQSKGQLLGFTMLNDWERIDAEAIVTGQSLTVAEIPSARMTTSQIYKLDMSDNDISKINFLNLVEEVREEINFSNNRIDNISGLGRLQRAKTVNLSSNNIESLDNMNAIETITNLNISNNPDLNDISQLRNISGVVDLKMNNIAATTLAFIDSYDSLDTLEFEGSPVTDISALENLNVRTIKLSNPILFTSKPDFSSKFCQDYYNDLLNNFEVSGREFDVKYNGKVPYITNLCDNVPSDIAWLLFFKAENQLLHFTNFYDWETLNATATVSDINLVNSLLPPTPFDIDSIYSLNISENNLDNVSFLSGLSEVRLNLLLNDNNITDFTGLNDLESVFEFDISNNDMTIFNPLNLKTVSLFEINNNDNLEELNFPLLENINELNITNNSSLKKLLMPSLNRVLLDTKIENNGEVDFSINNIDFNSTLSIKNNNFYSLEQDDVYRVGYDFYINENNNLEDITLNVEDQVGRSLYIEDNDNLKTIDIQSIANLGWGLYVQRNNLLESLSINNISTQGGSTGFVLKNNSSLDNVSINNVNNVSGELILTDNDNLKTVSISNIINNITYNLHLNKNNSLETININDVNNIGKGILAGDLMSLKEFNASNIGNIGYSINLNNNPELTKVNLNNVQRIGFSLNLIDNPKLTDLSGLSNLYEVGTGLIIDEPSQYTVLPDYETPFCTGITASDIIPKYNNKFVSILELCNNVPEHAEWLDIFHSYNQMRDVDTIFEWNLDENTSTVYLNGKDLSENVLPAFPINTSKLYTLYISDNEFTQLDILDNLTEIRRSLYAQNNLINDISNLEKLTRVGTTLDLSNNKLINVDALSSLTYVGTELSLHTNGTLVDISGLRNITSAKRIELDSPEQYLEVMEGDSPFCQALATQDIKVYVGNTNQKIQMRFLCKDSNDTDLWLNLFHSYDQLLNYSLINEWESNNGIGDLSGNNLSDLDIPKSPLETTSLYDMILSDNSIVNLDFMSNVVEVRRYFYANNNEINNIDGLRNVTNYIKLYLSNNIISDVSPLDNIQTKLIDLDLSFNDIERVPNLSNFTEMDNLYFNDNVSLTDISGLSTIKEIKNLYLQNTQISDLSSLSGLEVANEILLDDPSEYSPKLDYTTNFCDGIKNDLIYPYHGSDLIDIRGLCQNLTDDYLWLLFFRDNGQLVNYNDISEWESNDNVASVTNLLLSDLEMPKGLIGVNTLFSLNLSGNILTNVNFMQDIIEVRSTLNLSNNNLNDISGLTNMSSIINLYLQDNPNLTDISALSNISVINNLNISNTGRSNLSGLDSLTTINDTFDISGNENLKELSFLNQIVSANKIILDIEEQYIKLDYDSNIICENVNNGTVSIYDVEDNRLSADYICDNEPSEFLWLSFLKAFDKQNDFNNYYSLQEWLTKDTIADLSILNFVDSDIPNGSIGVDSIYSLDISDNEITNVDFMIDTTEIRNDLRLNNNLISNIEGLQNINNYLGDLNLRNNKLTNLEALSHLNKWGLEYHEPGFQSPYGGNPGVTATNLDLRYNDLLNVDGLINMTEIRYANLYISDNPSLTDITGLSNIQLVDNVRGHRHTKPYRGCGSCGLSSSPFYIDHLHYIVIDDPSQYIEKPEVTSPFCDAVSNLNVALKTSTSDESVTTSEVCNVVDEWMLFLHSYDRLKWEVLPEVLDDKELTIDLSNTNISNNVLPDLNLTFSNPYILDLSSNNLDNIDFMTTLTGIRNKLDISDNNIDNVNGLSNITSITGSVWLNDNEQLIDLIGISNISTTNNGKIYIDSPAQYTKKPLVESPLCQGLIAGNVLVDTYNSETMTSREVTAFELCDASNAWLDFLKENGQATNLFVLSELNNQETPIDLSNNDFIDADIPVGALGMKNLLNFNISNNQLSDLKFLLGLKNIKEDLDVSGNNFTTLYGFDDIILVEGSLDISNNTGLKDISDISDLQRVLGVLYVDEPVQYTIKPDVSSDFCIALSNDLINIEEKSTGRKIDVNEICYTSDAWLAYFHENDVLFDNLILQDWNTDNLTIDISSRNLLISDVPSVVIDLTEIYNFDISENNFENIDFMSNITKVNKLLANDNNSLVNVNGLSSVTEVVEELNLQRNTDLTDITGLANISSGVIYLNDSSQYTNKPDVTTPFCIAVYNSTGTATKFDEATFKVGEVCSTTDQWLQHFYNNNLMMDSVDIKDMEDQDITIDLSNKNYTNSDIPSAIFGVNSIYKIDFKNNQLQSVNFLANIVEVRDSLDLSLNNLINVNGLFSLSVVNNLFLNGNNLTDISGLINIQELKGYLYLNGNPNLTNISYLENIQVNNPDYPIYLDDPSQYTTKVDGSSLFCIALQNGNIKVINADNGLELTSEDLCSYGIITVDSEGYFIGTDSDYTYLYPKTLVSGEKKYAEWEFKGGENVSTRLGIGITANPNINKDKYIGQGDNSIAFWGYTWLINNSNTSVYYEDTSTNVRLGISFDYSKFPIESSLYVNGVLQDTKIYSGDEDTFYFGFSRYYSLPPHKVFFEQEQLYRPEGFDSF
mgnify:FL=1